MGLSMRRLALLVAMLSLCVAVWEARRLVVIRHWNAVIGAGVRVTDPHAPSEARFADAFVRGRDGDLQGALNVYRELEGGATGEGAAAGVQLRRDAMFNSGNLYLGQAIAERAGADPSAALTLVELAKESYRDLLREDSGDWDARYNLEKALRLAPDPEEDSAAMSTPPSRLHTATTGRGAGLGLP